MYSEHGFEALIGAVFFEVCQRLIVVSYCMPGSPQMYADSAIMRIRSRALYVSTRLAGNDGIGCSSRHRS